MRVRSPGAAGTPGCLKRPQSLGAAASPGCLKRLQSLGAAGTPRPSHVPIQPNQVKTQLQLPRAVPRHPPQEGNVPHIGDIPGSGPPCPGTPLRAVPLARRVQFGARPLGVTGAPRTTATTPAPGRGQGKGQAEGQREEQGHDSGGDSRRSPAATSRRGDVSPCSTPMPPAHPQRWR